MSTIINSRLGRFVLTFLLMVMVVATVLAFPDGADAATFSPRTVAPLSSNPYYNSTYNIYAQTSWGSMFQPNGTGYCTTYAWGRAYEITGKKPAIPVTNAKDWWAWNVNNKAYPYGSEPKLGAIICWEIGALGGGHVAVVEAINGNNVTFSESNQGGIQFRTYTMPKGSMGAYTAGFKGYIYVCDGASSSSQPAPGTSSATMSGTVNTPGSALNVRSGPGTNYSVLGTLAHGTKVSFTVENSSWYKISYSGRTGYISSAYVITSAAPAASVPAGVNPQGVLDSAGGARGTVTVSGWAFDKDKPTTPIDVHVYIGGPAGQGTMLGAATANKNRPDVGKVYPGVGDNHGFSATFNTGLVGQQTVYVYAINAPGTGGSNPCIGTKAVTVYKTITNGDLIRVGTAVYVLAGGAPVWVSDWNNIGGVKPYTDISQAEYNALRAYPADGTYLSGYKSGRVFLVAAGGHPYYIRDWNMVGGPKPSTRVDDWAIDNGNHLNCSPFGSFDNASGGAGTVSIRGWAVDGDVVASGIDIQAYVGGPTGSGEAHLMGKTNATRTDVNTVYPGTGNNHGYEFTFSTNKTGTQTIYVYAVNAAGTAGGNTLLGTKTVTIAAPAPVAPPQPPATQPSVPQTPGEGPAVIDPPAENPAQSDTPDRDLDPAGPGESDPGAGYITEPADQSDSDPGDTTQYRYREKETITTQSATPPSNDWTPVATICNDPVWSSWQPLIGYDLSLPLSEESGLAILKAMSYTGEVQKENKEVCYMIKYSPTNNAFDKEGSDAPIPGYAECLHAIGSATMTETLDAMIKVEPGESYGGFKNIGSKTGYLNPSFGVFFVEKVATVECVRACKAGTGAEYVYERWGSWSDWSATPAVASSTREVETR